MLLEEHLECLGDLVGGPHVDHQLLVALLPAEDKGRLGKSLANPLPPVLRQHKGPCLGHMVETRRVSRPSRDWLEAYGLHHQWLPAG
jgi:hypothetical protein